MTRGPPSQATCPKCGSPSVQAVPIEKKKLGRAMLTESLLGTAAGVSAGSAVVIQAICLSCGCRWFPGTAQERSVRALSGQLGEDAKRAEEQRREQAARRARDLDRWLAAIAVVVLAVLVIGWLLTSR